MFEENTHFPEIVRDRSDENLKEYNHRSKSEISASGEKTTENNSEHSFHIEKVNLSEWKKSQITEKSAKILKRKCYY